MRLGVKMAGVILLFTLTASLVLYLVGQRNRESVFNEIARGRVRYVQETFENLQKTDRLMLSAVLEPIARDATLQAIYLSGSRDELYAFAQPLFQTLRERYRITHFYFIDPDGRVFLRLHNPGLSGDLVRRQSFLAAKATGALSTEMGLGKTAFALRAVVPWRRDGRLIGYLELGEEINHFLTALKRETASEFGFVGEKSLLDRADWQSVRSQDGRVDTWDVLKNHVVIASTSESDLVARCFSEQNLGLVERGDRLCEEVENAGRVFMCGGFPLAGDAGEHVGAVLSLIDVTEHAALAEQGKRSVLLAAGLLFAVTFPAGILLSRPLTRAIANLTRVAEEVGRGNLERRANVSGSDEIAVLAAAFNDMIERRRSAEDALQRSRDGLERAVAESSAELREANERLHSLSAYLQEVGEQERTRIAREIHDELGQALTAIKMELSLLRRGLEGRQIIERADALSALVESTTGAVRRISQDLRPGILDHLGLSAAVEWQAEEFERRYGISCAVSVEPADIVLDEARSTAVFRIFQEALTNVARHADAHGVSVTLRRGAADLTLEVQDDGRGINSPGAGSNSFGIIGMQERARAWGGTIGIASDRGAGTTVTARLPLTQEEGAQ